MSCCRRHSSGGRGLDLRRRRGERCAESVRVAVGARGRLADEGGWTLAELMVVTGIVVALAGIAVPQYSVLATQMRTQAASAQVLSDINYARMMSLRTGVPHYVVVTGDPDITYEVRRSANPPVIAGGEPDPVLRSIDLTDGMPGVNFDLSGASLDPYGGTVTTATPGQLVFGSRGLPTAPAAFFVANDDGTTAFAVSITGAGRTRLWRRANGGWK